MTSNGRAGDKTVGEILIEMGVCTSGQVARAAEKQSKDAEDKRIGMYLVALGFISQNQLAHALNAQEGLRSGKRHLRALAQASIAEQSTASVTELAKHVRQRSSETRRKITGEHAPVGGSVQPAAMLAKGDDGK